MSITQDNTLYFKSLGFRAHVLGLGNGLSARVSSASNEHIQVSGTLNFSSPASRPQKLNYFCLNQSTVTKLPGGEGCEKLAREDFLFAFIYHTIKGYRK